MRAQPVAPALNRHLTFPAPAPGREVSEGIAFTRRTLTAWFPDTDPAATGEAVLVAAELLANAAEHAGGPRALDLHATPDGLIRIEVTDATGTPPRIRPFAPQAPHGHGMRIIDRLSRTWGSRPTAGGKTVWAECALPYAAVPRRQDGIPPHPPGTWEGTPPDRTRNAHQRHQGRARAVGGRPARAKVRRGTSESP